MNVVLQSHFVDEPQLFLEEVDMVFLACLDVDQKLFGPTNPAEVARAYLKKTVLLTYLDSRVWVEAVEEQIVRILHEVLNDSEIVVAGEVKPKGGSFVIIAEIKKPGLSAFLQGLVKQFAPGPDSPLRILSPQQLVTAKATSKQPALVLVRPDLVVITSEMSTLKSFNAQLIRPGGKLASTPFGQRLAQAYQGGAAILFGADLEHIKGLVPTNTKKDQASFQQTGFADVKYLIAERKDAGGETSNNAELSFNGPRHGVASWLAAPAPLGSLDFTSTDAALATSLAILTASLTGSCCSRLRCCRTATSRTSFTRPPMPPKRRY